MVYKVKTEFAAALYNVLNTTQFAAPDGEVTDGSNFGKLKTPRLFPTQRQLELVLKVSF